MTVSVVAFTVFFLTFASFSSAGVCPIGSPGKFPAKNVTFLELVKNPLQFIGTRVRVSECTVTALLGVHAYTSIELGNVPSSRANIGVSADNQFFTFPLDCLGASAEVEGLFTASKDLLEMSISATAVTLESSGVICRSWPNSAVVHDMDKSDFEANDYMGSGLVSLPPGGHMHAHSTNTSTEIVTVFAGEVVVTLLRGADREEHVLVPHLAILIPHSTPHTVENRGKVTATYLYVHAGIPVGQQ